jgi:CubicO group peptidase (beta-lactamase class C family)
MPTRRTLLAAAAMSPVLTASFPNHPPATAEEATPPALSAATPEAAALPMTGQAVPALAGLDHVMSALMPKWHLPGGQLAVAKDGRLVFNRGYGLADVEGNVPVPPEALFRIASVTKPITAVAILTLVDAGTLALDDKAFPCSDLRPPPTPPAIHAWTRSPSPSC